LASSVSANNPELVKYVERVGFGRPKPIWHKPPLNLEMFVGPDTLSRQALRAQYGIRDGAAVMIYMGSFFYFSGLIEVLKRMSRDRSETTLLLVGGGEMEQDLRIQVAHYGLESRVIFVGFVDFERLPQYLRMGDVAINPMKSMLVSNTAFPNKVIQYMAAGLPVVSVDLTGMSLILGEAPGLSLEPTPEEVWDTASKLAMSGGLAKLGQLNREFVTDIFDYSREIRQIRKHLEALTMAPRRENGETS